MNATRRGLIGACGSLVFGARLARATAPSSDAIATIEHVHGGRLGVFALETVTGRTLAWRADETFPMQSTFKGPLAAMVLSRVQAHQQRLDEELAYGPSDMMPASPVTAAHLQRGKLPVGELTAAILEFSDNTAANLLLAHVGGPAALTRYVRSLGDNATEILRPEMRNPPPTGFNTTEPRAFAMLMQTMLLGATLQPKWRAQLRTWMAANHPGRTRLRAAFPSAWSAADRTGTGDGICNDGAVAWPPRRAPLTMAVFYVAPGMELALQEAVMRKISHAIVAGLA